MIEQYNRNLKKIGPLLCLFGWALLFIMADNSTVHAAPKKYPFKITTTTGMITDIVRQVAGDRGQVTGLIGEGVDPHLYTPTRGDVAAFLTADIIFYSGLKLEGKMADTLEKVARSGKPVYAVTESIAPSYILEPPEFKGHPDPHVWMDPTAWQQAVDAVARFLSAYDSTNAAVYQSNAAQYNAQLKKLTDYVQASIGTIPKDRRVLITAHDAFNYFGRAFDIEVKGIQGISTESEAGLQDINNLIDYIVERKIQAVFVETSVSDKNVRALTEGAAARHHKMIVGGTLFSDAMGAPGTYEGTYIGMIDHNATVIARALGGTAPAKGFQGKLSQH